MTTVFPTELARAFVADGERRARRIKMIRKHPASRSAQAKLLLILQGAHRSQSSKVTV